MRLRIFISLELSYHPITAVVKYRNNPAVSQVFMASRPKYMNNTSDGQDMYYNNVVYTFLGFRCRIANAQRFFVLIQKENSVDWKSDVRHFGKALSFLRKEADPALLVCSFM